ncbi:MAG: peptidoglycan-binding protein [Lachnospiraceae bacterium]|nr:peptidoglycan-binding protein [Lachnospiraceae bacterium]
MPQENNIGRLLVNVRIERGYIPVPNARVVIQSMDGSMEPLTYMTDSSGQTPEIELAAPPLVYSESPEDPQPYSEYIITVDADGYETSVVEGTEILPGELSIQAVPMQPLETGTEQVPPAISGSVIIIPEHTLYGDYPAKIPEAEVKPVPESGEIVLSRVVIPEYIIVHDGLPTDSSAPNYWVRYTDYIKNVASSEIYATWEDSTILANILVIMSFTLNRVYTEYYRSRGYDFTITSSTAYDQKFVYGRNIYENISYLVDQVFNNYLARPGVTQPIFTSYCDGQRATCSGLSQWGSKYLGDEGYSAIEIIRYYYGSDMYIATAEQISGVPASYPGYDLTIGSTGDKVRQLQQQLNRISQNYPAIPQLNADGIYGALTAESVRAFQKIFSLPQTGVTDFPTWYAISRIYVAVSRISEPGAY